MSLFTPIFERRGVLVAWLLDNAFVLNLDGNSIASVQPDGGVVSTDLAVHFGGFTGGFFRDVDGLPVAFVDRSLEKDSPPDESSMLSPAVACRVKEWSRSSWRVEPTCL